MSFFSRHRLWRCFLLSDCGPNVFVIFKFDAQMRRRAAVVEKPRTAWADKQRRGSLGYVRDRLFDYARPSAVSRDPSVKRSAQDDDFVRVGTENFPIS